MTMGYKPQHAKQRFTTAQKRRFVVSCIEVLIYFAAAVGFAAMIFGSIALANARGVL